MRKIRTEADLYVMFMYILFMLILLYHISSLFISTVYYLLIIYKHNCSLPLSLIGSLMFEHKFRRWQFQLFSSSLPFVTYLHSSYPLRLLLSFPSLSHIYPLIALTPSLLHYPSLLTCLIVSIALALSMSNSSWHLLSKYIRNVFPRLSSSYNQGE